nr:alginate lyase family protein [uncultured Bacteroides sp.]
MKRRGCPSHTEYNLQHLIEISMMGAKMNIPVLAETSSDGRSIYKAADFLKQYLGKDVSEWPYKQISGWENAQQALCKDLYKIYLLDSTQTEYLEAYHKFQKNA